MIGFVDTTPNAEPKNGHILVSFKSGDTTAQFILTRHAALSLGLKVREAVAMAVTEEMGFEPTPFTRKKGARTNG